MLVAVTTAKLSAPEARHSVCMLSVSECVQISSVFSRLAACKIEDHALKAHHEDLDGRLIESALGTFRSNSQGGLQQLLKGLQLQRVS